MGSYGILRRRKNKKIVEVVKKVTKKKEKVKKVEKLEKVASVLTFLALLVSFGFTLSWFLKLEKPLIISSTTIIPGLTSFFRIDLFSLFLAFLSLIICMLITIFNFSYPCERKISYYILFLLCEFGILGIAFSYDFFTLLPG